MKVQFEGTPDVVLKEMREYIARCSIEFGQQEEELPKVVDAKPVPLPSVPQLYPPAPAADAPTKEQVPQNLGNEPQQKSGELACQFCVRYTGSSKRIARHERYCKKNPNRTPWPTEGKPVPWLKKKSTIQDNMVSGEGSGGSSQVDQSLDDGGYF